MANLKYKTRGNSTPQGKPRVYFCCHRNDFEKYFEEISNEVLTKQNCAIWFVDEAVEYNEDLFLDLKQMQLFVMPVTTNLLCTENDVLNVEFKFAIENHIPVLPLMQENGLIELFNEKCGELQFLDKHNTDITAISYDEKLEKYLSSVLIGDELAEKIRAAFDAYVFLSYRKKDRKYARELMHLIHKNDFCRDIAIWYDEFLTPGEDFNESIKEALEKSELFVLTVTPNLVNEINYIMTTEYPMAKRDGKTILPAELVPTDRQKLSEQYVDIPVPTDAHNETELSEALLESVKKIAVKENDGSPEHNFFIGLAYLDGIDVEIDVNRAESLIRNAAEANLPEAIEKLVFMYSHGKGVARDYFQAIEWQKRLIEVYNKKVSRKDDSIDFSSLSDELQYLATLYEYVAMYEEARKAYRQIIEFSDNVGEEGAKRHNNTSVADALLNLAKIEEKHGNISDAVDYYKKCILMREAKIGTYHEKSALASVLISIGDLYAVQHQIEEAHLCYDRSKGLLETIPSEEYTFVMILTIANMYHSIGRLCEMESQPKKAIRYYLESSGFLERFINTYNNDTLFNNLASTYLDISSAYVDINKSDEAVEYATMGKEMLEANCEKLKTVFSRLQLCSAYGSLASAYWANNNERETLYYVNKEIVLLENIVKASNVYEHRQRLAMSYLDLGQFSSNSSTYEYYVKSRNILAELYHENGNSKTLYNLCFVTKLMIEMCKAENKENLLKEGMILAEKLLETKSFRNYSLCADYYHEMGEYYKGDSIGRNYFLKELNLREKIVQQSEIYMSYVELASLYGDIGMLYSKLGMDFKGSKYSMKDLKVLITKSYKRSKVSDTAKHFEKGERTREYSRKFMFICGGILIILSILGLVFDLLYDIKTNLSLMIIGLMFGVVALLIGVFYYSRK